MARLPRLPDLLTTANLVCGTASIPLAFSGELTIACWLLFGAALFDVFDGLIARTMGGGSALGVQLDSLADMVSFGVAPGILLYHTAGLPLAAQLANGGPNPPPSLAGPQGLQWVALAVAALIPVASAWRLAKFNLDTRQTHGFLGLPTPANALFWAGTLLGLHHLRPEADPTQVFNWLNPWLPVGVALLLAILMLSEVPLPGLKFKHGGWAGNEVIFLLAGVGVLLVLLYGFLAVPLLLVLYLLSPLWGKLFPKPE